MAVLTAVHAAVWHGVPRADGPLTALPTSRGRGRAVRAEGPWYTATVAVLRFPCPGSGACRRQATGDWRRPATARRLWRRNEERGWRHWQFRLCKRRRGGGRRTGRWPGGMPARPVRPWCARAAARTRSTWATPPAVASLVQGCSGGGGFLPPLASALPVSARRWWRGDPSLVWRACASTTACSVPDSDWAHSGAPSGCHVRAATAAARPNCLDGGAGAAHRPCRGPRRRWRSGASGGRESSWGGGRGGGRSAAPTAEAQVGARRAGTACTPPRAPPHGKAILGAAVPYLTTAAGWRECGLAACGRSHASVRAPPDAATVVAPVTLCHGRGCPALPPPPSPPPPFTSCRC